MSLGYHLGPNEDINFFVSEGVQDLLIFPGFGDNVPVHPAHSGLGESSLKLLFYLGCSLAQSFNRFTATLWAEISESLNFATIVTFHFFDNFVP